MEQSESFEEGQHAESRVRPRAYASSRIAGRLALVGRVATVVLCLAASGSCNKSATSPTPVRGAPTAIPTASIAEAVLVGAGDINMCGQPGATATAAILDRIPGTVFTAGDNAYMRGSKADYECYDRAWGRHRGRTFATPGNHEYDTPGATPYFEYFGERAGPFGLGYYSYEVGAWHVVSLNSSVPASEGSAQLSWLRADLQSARVPCVAAIIHHPLISSGPNGDNPQVRELWRALEQAGAELVVSGHDHLYERHARIDFVGRPSQRGLRLFTVGTGGATLYQSSAMRPTTEAKVVAWGVIKFTLLPTSYRWEFHTTDGIVDSGLDLCQ
jgi:hypothetical protein